MSTLLSNQLWRRASWRSNLMKISRVIFVLVYLLSILGESIIPARADSITFLGGELLGKPTDTSITINIVPDTTIVYLYEFGTVEGGPYPTQTSTVTAIGGQPHEVTITGLTPNTRYYYRMLYDADGSVTDGDYEVRDEHNFHTQRAEGDEFVFTVTSDSHGNFGTNTATNILNDEPDFNVDLGDTFMVDQVGETQTAYNNRYIQWRGSGYFGGIGQSVPIYLAMGNHEEEEGWNFDDTPSRALLNIETRKLYFPMPNDGGFYTASTETHAAISGDQLRENYYAWEWGDALFVIIDPYQHTMNLPYSPIAGEESDETVDGDQWSWTLGIDQYTWLKTTLENSNAKYKFVFSHNMVGGVTTAGVSGGPGYVRGGAEAAGYFEWGGYDAAGNYAWDTERPSAAGWDVPIQDLFEENGVSAYFHGHDHQFVYEERGGVVYQEVPSPSMGATGFPGIYTEGDFTDYYGDYSTIEIQPNSGHLRISVTPTEATVDYMPSSGGATNYTYTIDPNVVTEPDYYITATAGANGSISPSGSVGVVAGEDQTFTITPNGGYQVADVLVDGGSEGAVASYTFFDVDDDHTISATFEETPLVRKVTVDGDESSETGNEVDSLSFAHTTGTGANRLLLVGVSWNCGTTDRSITSVTFTPSGGSALALAAVFTQQGENSSADPRYSAIYSLLAPPSGVEGTVVVNFSGSVSNGIVAGAANFAGVDQTTPLGSPAGADETSDAAPTITLTGLEGDELVFDNVFQGATDETQTLTAGANQTPGWNGWISNTRAAASTEQATSSSVTMSWTADSASVWAIAAVPINPAPFSGTTYTLTMASAGNGTTTPAVGLHVYPENSVVGLSATPNSGYVFDSWTGDADCVDGSVTMDADKNCTATFEESTTPVLDGTVSSDTADGVNSLSFSHTTGTGADRLMLVGISWNNYTTLRDLSSVTFTYDTTELSLTEVELAENEVGRKTAIYSLLNPPSGEVGTVTITFDGVVNYGIVAGATNFAGVDPIMPLGPSDNAAGNSSTVSMTLAGLDGDELIFDSVWIGSGADATADSSQTPLWNTNVDYARGAASIEAAAGSAAVQMDWVPDSSIQWAIAAVAINPVETGPRIAISGTPLNDFEAVPGSYSVEQSYTVSGLDLTDDITITAPSDFEISLVSGSDFGSSLVLPQTGGEVEETPIYVRFYRATEGTSSGNITHTSIDATTQYVAVSGTAAPLAPVLFNILLGRPTDESITANIIPDQDAEFYIEYGISSGVYTGTTSTFTALTDEPIEIVIDGLSANTEYFYRIVYRHIGTTEWNNGAEYSFDTQKAPGSTFTFTIISDSHLGQYGGQDPDELALYEQTLQNVLADQPDFHIDNGDTFAMDPLPPYGSGLGNGMTAENAEAAYYLQRPYLNAISAEVPVYLAIGNHENEEGWNWNDVFTPPEESLAIVGMRARKIYFPNPIPDDFYTGNEDAFPPEFAAAYGSEFSAPSEEYRENYFAWTWGDALFVVIDPTQYSMIWPNEDGSGYGGEGQDGEVSGDRWDWTLGIEQYLWLKDTLENSDATFKFVFSHHVTGGSTSYARGGISAAPYFEWGGYNADDTWGWDTERPAAEGWTVPIHQLFIDNGVNAYIHGHDHIYAYEELDGIAYLEVPKPDDAGYDWDPYGYGYNEDLYPNAIAMIPNSGHIRVTVSPTEATFEYVRSYLPEAIDPYNPEAENGDIAHSFTVVPPSTEEIALSSGWNLVTLEIEPETPITAQSLLEAINGQGGACEEVDRWSGGYWDPHLNAYPGINDFPIEMGQSYFLRCSQSSSWVYQGTALSSGIGLGLAAGWNLVGVPYPSGYDAQTLLEAINGQGGNCEEVDGWNGSYWDPHLNAYPGINVFPIEPNQGYFLRCTQTSSFTP